jgi:uncharacterized protein
MTKPHTNELINETSPYLLQHAHNPVNWFPWGDAALKKARDENKAILVSIGYAACHWCHVMERESFEDEATAVIMNDHFVNIKIDREERPDLDHIYMDAVQAMTGSGGWPLNVFLTPEGKPFYGGTYFPPQRAFNRASWKETLENVAEAFMQRRHEVNAQAENLTEHLLQSNSFGLQKSTEADEIFLRHKIDEACQNILTAADKEWGGFGKAPKFPQTFSIQFLLRYSYTQSLEPGNIPSPLELVPPVQEEGKGEDALQQSLLSLDKMIAGGIYDQIGGGFSRYSTDTEWLAPHFEKMLYDNALLISVLSEAYQLTKKEKYKEVIEETMEFVQRELLHPDKGFFAALDADSEGVEGKFYVWNEKEVKDILRNDAAVFSQYYDVTEKGNWEHSNIFRVRKSIEKVAAEKNIPVKELKEIIKSSGKKLLAVRSKRIRPQLDDKIILGWNALMNTACSKAFSATGNEAYRQLATDNMNFLLKKLIAADGKAFHHTWKNEIAKYPAFLDDYAFLIQALIQLQEVSADTKWLMKAKSLTDLVIENFSDTETPFFFYTPAGQQDVIVRKKEMYDGAVPSGNSIMADNLYRLAILFDKNDWKQRGLDMVSSIGKAITKYPNSFGNWASLLQEIVSGTNEIAVVGKDFSKIHHEILGKYIPHKVLMVAATTNNSFPLLAEKKAVSSTTIFLCRNYTCQKPVFSANQLMWLINSRENNNLISR